MKRKYILIWILMAIITIVLSLLLIFYPRRYLYIYKNKLNIDYNEIEKEKGYSWSYELSNDNLKIVNSSDDEWEFIPNKNGVVTITFYYKENPDSSDYLYKIEYNLKVKKNKICWMSGQANGLLYYPNPY